jgi:hypothetical protein
VIVEYTIRNGLVGCAVTDVIELEDEMDDDEIDEAVQEAVHQRIEWSWEKKS